MWEFLFNIFLTTHERAHTHVRTRPREVTYSSKQGEHSSARPLATHIPSCTLAPTLSPALNSCPSVCRQHTGNTRARGRSSAAEGSRVAEGIGHSAGEQQGVLFEGEFQRFSEGGVQSIRSPCCQSRQGSRQAGKLYCWTQAGQVVVIVRL